MYEHNALGYWLGLALCLTKVSSSRARCPVTALISQFELSHFFFGHFSEWIEGTLCVRLLLQFNTDTFESLQTL